MIYLNYWNNFRISGELITIGRDGWIRVWDLESICNARATDAEAEKAVFHLDPMNEVEVEPGTVI